jgi:NOL1/NOP2/fmu family ribosome biogenesis protein
MRKSPQLADGAHLKITKVGLRAFQRVGAFIKPTTRFIQIFGRQATRGTYRLSRDQLQTLIAGEEIPVDLEMDKGYVILTLGRDDALGLGFFINHAIRSQLPKGELRPEMMI